MRRNDSSSHALNVTFTTSAWPAALRTSGRLINEPLLSSAVLNPPAARTCRSTSPNPVCIVGSPEPDKVMKSARWPAASQRSISASTAAVGTHSRRAAVSSVVRPTWQNTQSSVQTFRGFRSTPSDSPSRRDGTGPKRY